MDIRGQYEPALTNIAVLIKQQHGRIRIAGHLIDTLQELSDCGLALARLARFTRGPPRCGCRPDRGGELMHRVRMGLDEFVYSFCVYERVSCVTSNLTWSTT